MKDRIMNPKRTSRTLLIGVIAAVTGWPDARSADRAASVGETEALQIATDAYIYGYPLVTMEMTRRVMTNVATPDGKHAPMGQFALMRGYPTAKYRDVTAPNADTLYSVAWLDLSHEPYIFSIPDAHGRYFL